MAFRQAVIQLGSSTVKAGLWEQTFLPTTEIPACVNVLKDSDGQVVERKFGERTAASAIFPITDGCLVDADELEHLLRHVLLTCLQLNAPLTDVPVLLVVPGGWTRSCRQTLLRLLLERIGVAGVYFGEAPLMAAFACACPNALVIDVGHSVTEVAALIEGDFNATLHETLPVGGREFDEQIVHLLTADSNSDFIAQARAKGIDWEEEKLEIARTWKEANSTSTFTFRGISLCAPTIDAGRAFDPLFDTGTGAGGVVDAVTVILKRCDPEMRAVLFDHVIVTGGSSRHPALLAQIKANLTLLLTCSGNAAEYQLRAKALDKPLEVRTVPPYYPEIWQRATPLAAWFGAGITAKCVLGDPKNYATLEKLTATDAASKDR